MTMPTDAIVCSWIRPVAFACGCVHFGTSSRTFRTSAFIGLSATWSIPLTTLWTEVSKASLARLAGGETHPLKKFGGSVSGRYGETRCRTGVKQNLAQLCKEIWLPHAEM